MKASTSQAEGLLTFGHYESMAMSPVLSHRARRETKSSGAATSPHSNPDSVG